MISASFLKIKENLKENLQKLDQTSISYLHFDIMDGEFVPNKTWHLKELLPALSNLKKPFDVHFMVKDVQGYIQEFEPIHPKYMTFHIEATEEPKKIIDQIRQTGSKVGISLKPNTPIETLKPYLSEIDLVLVMCVEPGKGGQPFLEASLEKIKTLDTLRKENHYSYLIEVDGGINPETKKQCEQLGADMFVVGSYITDSNDYEKQVNNLIKTKD